MRFLKRPCLGWDCGNQKATDSDSVPVHEQNGRYFFRIANQQLAVNPAFGGRITLLTMNRKDFFTGPDVNDFNGGYMLVQPTTDMVPEEAAPTNLTRFPVTICWLIM